MKTLNRHTREGGVDRAGGFTLIEVMIAAGLLGLEMLALTTLFTSAIRSNNYAQRLVSASTIAQSAVESAKNTAYANLTLQNGTVCFDKDMATIACGTRGSIYTRVIATTLDSPITGLASISVTVSWMDDQGYSHQTKVDSQISKY